MARPTTGIRARPVPVKARAAGLSRGGLRVQDQAAGIEQRGDGDDAGEAEDCRQAGAYEQGTGSHQQKAGDVEGGVDVLPVPFLLAGGPVRGGFLRISRTRGPGRRGRALHG